MLNYFIQSLLTDEEAIPDYTNPTASDDSVDRFIFGQRFTVNHWNHSQRDLLLTPSLVYAPETYPELDESFHRYADYLGLPNYVPFGPISSIQDFDHLSDSAWFQRVAKIMSTYCQFFRYSSALSSCSPKEPQTSLVTAIYGHSPYTNALNPFHTLRHAFPDEFIVDDICQHISSETSIIQPYD